MEVGFPVLSGGGPIVRVGQRGSSEGLRGG